MKGERKQISFGEKDGYIINLVSIKLKVAKERPFSAVSF